MDIAKLTAKELQAPPKRIPKEINKRNPLGCDARLAAIRIWRQRVSHGEYQQTLVSWFDQDQAPLSRGDLAYALTAARA